MVDKIEVKISKPSGVYKTLNSKKVQIPAYEGDITILTGRAPSVFKLTCGVVRSLDEHFKPVEQIFVSEGFAEYANGTIKVLVENAVSASDIKLEEALKFSEESEDISNRKFYAFVADYLKK